MGREGDREIGREGDRERGRGRGWEREREAVRCRRDNTRH